MGKEKTKRGDYATSTESKRDISIPMRVSEDELKKIKEFAARFYEERTGKKGLNVSWYVREAALKKV